jgi:Zn finger protein HypA/HybF involved in hydrogenase expression
MVKKKMVIPETVEVRREYKELVCPECGSDRVHIDYTLTNTYPHFISDRLKIRTQRVVCDDCESVSRRNLKIVEQDISPEEAKQLRQKKEKETKKNKLNK